VLRQFDNLINKSAFPKVLSLEHELKKAALLRILLGFIVFVRFAEICNTYCYLNFGAAPIVLCFLFLFLILCFTVGFFAPLAAFLLLCFSVRMDIYFGTFTLGTTVLTTTVLPLFLINAGQYYSLDRLILKKGGWVGKIIGPLYKLVGAKEENDVRRAYFLAFLCYAIVSFGALLLHIRDEYWVQGLTTKSLLLNSYLCKHYDWFRFIDLKSPYLLSVISITAGVFQSIFQFLMIPLIFTRIGEKFVFIWGLIFFFISILLINLSYLPPIEIVLWFLILKPVSVDKKQVTVLYDDYCNLCKKAMRFLKKINFNGRIVFLPISKSADLVKQNNLEEKEVRAYMVGFLKEKIYKGFDLYYEIVKINPLLWPFLPVFFLGKITGLGRLVYNYIAERRYRVFGTCEISFGDEIAAPDLPLQKKSSTAVVSVLYRYYFFMLLIYLLFRMPHLKDIMPKTNFLDSLANKTLTYSGFDLPNVFNKTDLSMGDNWVEIYRLDNNGWNLLPINGTEGERLNYRDFDILNLSNHNSDKLYFGNTLQFRRALITTGIEEFLNEKGRGWYFLRMTLSYDFKMNRFTEKKKYMVLAYKNSTSIVSHDKTDQAKFKKHLTFKSLYVFNGKELSEAAQ